MEYIEKPEKPKSKNIGESNKTILFKGSKYSKSPKIISFKSFSISPTNIISEETRLINNFVSHNKISC